MNAQENHLDALDTYSSSITSPFEQTLAAAAAKSANITNDPGWAVGIPLLLFLLSVVPAIPALVTWIIGRIFRPSVLVVFGTEIPVHVVWFWYLTCFIVFGSLLALGIAWKSHQSKLIERRFPNDELLTVQQFRFALCSAVIREIEAYRTNKRTVHLEKAFDYWNQFILQVDDLFQEGTHYRYGSRIPYVLGSLYPVEGTVEEKTNALTTNAKRSRFLLSYITKLIAKSSWFEVSPATEAIVKAFDDFIPKITFRLVDRRDLGQLSECLRSLREYLYTRIPDLTDSEATRKQLDEQANASISYLPVNSMECPRTSQNERNRKKRRVQPN